MDHYATRYPTNVIDIAAFLVRLAGAHAASPLPPILHYSAAEPYTKYEICLILAQLSQPKPLDHAHIIPDEAEPVIPLGGVGRPKDCRLSVSVIEKPVSEGGLGMDVLATGFREWWEEELSNSK